MDPYHNIPRLNMAKFDGSPMNPMYLAMSPPQMLPTTTIHSASTSSGAAAATSGASKLKRSLGLDRELPIAMQTSKTMVINPMNPDHVWWMGLTLTGIGGLLYFGPRRMGMQI